MTWPSRSSCRSTACGGRLNSGRFSGLAYRCLLSLLSARKNCMRCTLLVSPCHRLTSFALCTVYFCRSAAYSNALSHGGAEPAFSPAASRRASAVGAYAVPAAEARPSYDGGNGRMSAEPSAAGQRGAAAAAQEDDFISPPRAAPRPAAPAASPSADWNAYDERPAQAKGAYNFHNADESSTPVNARRTSVTGPAARPPPANDAGPPPPGFPTGGQMQPFLVGAAVQWFSAVCRIKQPATV